jgi:enediyne biosynthesis protein E4
MASTFDDASFNSGGEVRRSMLPKHRGVWALTVLLCCLSVTYAVFRTLQASGGNTSAQVQSMVLTPMHYADISGDDLAPARANPALPQPPSPFRFTEIAKQSNVDFMHFSGTTPARHSPTANGSGVAIFDFDNDGLMDLYFATGTLLPPGSAPSGSNRLYKNLGNNQFRDVTTKAGLDFRGYCHGIVAGDVDNDGDQDLFLCCYGTNALFRNNGNGTFTDISSSAGISGFHWSMGGAFLDYDNDGDLDLYITNYGQWKLPADDRECLSDSRYEQVDTSKKIRTYCSPKTITPERHILYKNNGNTTFTDVTDQAGVGRTDGRGFGVVATDLNDDGRIDLYVANDMCPNFLFLNKGDGTFEDVTESSGAGFDAHGLTHAGMGVDAEDIDGDRNPDIVVTNYWNEPNSLYKNLGGGFFEDRTPTSGMASDSTPWIGWGCALADFDNDTWPDCFVTNGHVDDNLHLIGQVSPYAQPPLLHRNLEGRRFLLATRDAGAYFDSEHVGRGAAFGDLDNDGDIDIVVNHKDDSPAILRNDTRSGHHWIRLILIGTVSNRDAVGCRVQIETSGRTIVRQRKGGASLESSNDPRILLGLGATTKPVKVSVRWPSGRRTIHESLATDLTYTITEPRTVADEPNTRAMLTAAPAISPLNEP